MDLANAQAWIDEYIERENEQAEIKLALLPNSLRQISKGWTFYLQSREFVETGIFSTQLVGGGPQVLLEDGILLKGGSLENPEDVLRRNGIEP